MLLTKNLSPRQLSFFTALVLSVPISLLIFIIEQSWLWGVGSFVIILGGSYLLISLVLEKFIYRKIKLIYKFIYQTKATKKEEMYYKYILPKKSIDEVREDVEAWAEKRNEEIELLRKNELFRKEFLQNLSHEFKTPIFSIQGYIESLLSGGMNNAEINKRFLENTSKNVDRLSHLLQDLDEITKLESGELNLSKSNFVIQDIINEVFETLSLSAENNKINFSIKKGCESPLIVYADREKIIQVIQNLVENSIKYGNPGGQIVASMYILTEK